MELKIIKSKIGKLLQELKRIIYFCYVYIGPYERTRIYKGFVLAYTRGYSLVSRIIGDNIYEPELSQRVVEELKRINSGSFLDVGANIGLVSLYILSELPHMKIFCIEPGPEQAKQLARTIKLNNLADKMQLFQYALGERKGEFQFAVHSSVHNSGDGFIDTKRAGKCRFITVFVDTLDNWWRSIGSRLIEVVKLDTEGAELWILRGAVEFIRHCRPVIFLEINEINLRSYPYRARDLWEHLVKLQYDLRTLDGDLITENNLDYYIKRTDSYVARPNEYRKG